MTAPPENATDAPEPRIRHRFRMAMRPGDRLRIEQAQGPVYVETSKPEGLGNRIQVTVQAPDGAVIERDIER